MRRLAVLIAGLSLWLPAGAAASSDAPFGHACTAQNGVRFCPTADDSQRVPSFDGVPIDVDVTLPPTGAGPFPTIVMLHGFPGQKTDFEVAAPEGRDAHTYHWNNVFFAQQGYAVVTLSFRGFARSCGVPDSRTSPACDRGWVHAIADQRWELHDVQHLLGLLADEGVTDPRRIGVTGTSMGGGSTMQLAFLRDRVRNVDGTLSPWRSPGGKELAIAAAYPRWGYTDLANALVPNGRALDYRVPRAGENRRPAGVLKSSTMNALANGGAAVANIAPKGADPTADLLGWQELLNAGEPYGSSVRSLADQFSRFKGTPGLDAGNAAPLLIQIGWTDPVFPAVEAVRASNRINLAVEGGAPVEIQVGDVGHLTAGNPLNQYVRFNDDGAAFFARHLKGEGEAPGAPGRVVAYLQGCPKGSRGSGAIERTGWPELARGSFVLERRSGRVSSGGGSAATAAVVDPVRTGDRCTEVDPGSTKGTAVLTRRSPGITLLGLTTISARVRAKGDGGQIDALLWERLPSGKQRIVDFGVYRLTDDQTGRIVFQLHGNGYRIREGSVVRLELRGRTPDLYRPSNGRFSVALSDVRAVLPTHDRPSRAKGIGRPPRAN